MPYSVKEIFYSIQGEGFHSGRPAVFCRFSGCNKWSGREIDRDKSTCPFCDTNFVGTNGTFGGKYENAQTLCLQILELWPNKNHQPFVILTGGEPMLQVDSELIEELKNNNVYIAIETNGSLAVPESIDWITVSPKDDQYIQKKGHELKLVYPSLVKPDSITNTKFSYYYLSPCMVNKEEDSKKNLENAILYCMQYPKWKLSIQTQKYLGIR